MPFYLLANKSAAITGGTTGIGRAIALEYLRQGCNVAVNHLDLESDAEHKQSLVSEAAALKQKDEKAGRLIDVAGDVREPATGKRLVEEAVREFGGLDVFVSNAGVCEFAEFLENETSAKHICSHWNLAKVLLEGLFQEKPEIWLWC
ncbi:putative General stress protein 39 [Glarea lozoyensis 74030]|uniref:Putative General stress protein 39 n=1 Tax=Glarea lozoyensis (strain ATCC 74030 / MF5533) TaxID=1104152 RepID=H0EMK4_GLAL7|nr:putative General stress protein 39 [Glarea lozoyensis 74030]